MSLFTALVKPQIFEFLTNLEIFSTDLKSPGLDIGNPASITSTPNSSNCFAIESLVEESNLQPGTCSPSRKVVSNISTNSILLNQS